MTDQTQPAPETGAGGDSVRADVLAAFETHGVDVSNDWSRPEPDKAASESVATGERQRDERGRFASKAGEPDKAPASAETAPTVEATEISGADKLDEKPIQASTPDAAPAGWPADAKAEWSKLTPAIQAAVIKRESEINEGGRRWSEEKRRYEETLTPVRAIAKRYGVDERESIQRLATAAEFMDRDPVNGLRWMARSYGLDLKQLADATVQTAPRVDPAFQALHQELNQLKQTFNAREQEEVSAEISRFAKDRPHFAEVRTTMGRLMETGEAESMEDAYEKACWALQPVREKLLAEREANTRSEREKAERERVDKARRGAVSINGSPSGLPASKPTSHGSVRDDVLAAWSKHASA